MTEEERFFSYVNYSDHCWEWQAGLGSSGYGCFNIKLSVNKWKAIPAHRYSYEYFVGPLGDNFCCHHCDNPLCVNPEHLRQGTNQDNVNDKMKRGRHYCWAKTHCPQGHEYDVLLKGKHRRCSKCLNKQQRESKRREYQDPIKREKILARNRAAYWRQKHEQA